MLVERGLIDEEQLENALREHARSGEPIGSVLVALEYIPEQTLRNVLLEQCGLDMTRQEGFGSGLLGELERRRVGHRPAGREHPAATEAAAAAEPVQETAPPPEPALPGAEEAVERNGAHDAANSSVDSLLETFEERSRALIDELAAMRRLLNEIATS
jgi:hypothetical protein